MQKRFLVPNTFKDIDVEIVDEPLNLLVNLFESDKLDTYQAKQKGIDYVVLPLYNEKTYQIPEKSGLNQWNAGGRKRNENEVYIPIPIKIHQLYPTFFPKRDEPFMLELPDGKILNAKVY